MSSRRKFREQFIQNMLKNHAKNSERPCRFSARDMEALLEQFIPLNSRKGNKFCLERPWLRDELYKHFQITDDFLMDRIFRALDKGSKGYLKIEDLLCGMSVMLIGNLDDQMQYCFQVYDLNADGYISKEEMFHLLKSTLIKQSSEEDPDEGVKDLVETAMKKLDCDHDGRVSLEDFKQAVTQDNLLLECLGTCLPREQKKKEFLQQLKKRI